MKLLISPLIILSIALVSVPLFGQSLNLIGSYDTPGNATAVFVQVNLAYIADGDGGLQIIDIVNPANPQLVGNISTSGAAVGVSVQGNYAFMAEGHAGIQIIDIAVASSPVLASSYDTPCQSLNVAVDGNQAFVADINGGLINLDVSNPNNPQLGGWYRDSRVFDIALGDRYAYLAIGSFGMLVVDINNPANINPVGNIYDQPNYTSSAISVLGDYAYLAMGRQGLGIIDISDPTHPIMIKTINIAGKAVDIFACANYLYVAAGDSGICIFNVTEPGNPRLLGLFETPGLASGIFADSAFIYVASGTNGLLILDFLPAGSPQIDYKQSFSSRDIPDISKPPQTNLFQTTYSSDVGVSAIFAPYRQIHYTYAYPLSVEITNYGAVSQDFNCIFQIIKMGAYQTVVCDTIEIMNMPASSIDTIVFNDSLILPDTGVYRLISYTALSDDENYANDTTVNYSFSLPHLFDGAIAIWFGNLDQTPIIGRIGQRIPIDVYILSSDFSECGSFVDLHMVLGADSTYIDSFLSTTEGQIYYLLSLWDNVPFNPPCGSPPNLPGWSSQAFWGFESGQGFSISCTTTTKLITYMAKVTNDNSIIGDTAQAFMYGIDLEYWYSDASSPCCGHALPKFSYFSPVVFTDSAFSNCQYFPGDINGNGSVIGSDITFGVRYFKGLAPPPPDSCANDSIDTPNHYLYVAADVNADCLFRGSDITRLVSYFRGTSVLQNCRYFPPQPFPREKGNNNIKFIR